MISGSLEQCRSVGLYMGLHIPEVFGKVLGDLLHIL